MKFLLFLPALLFLASCQTEVHKQDTPSPKFDIRLHKIDLPNTIVEIIPHNKGYLCLLNNKKLVLLDSNFKFQSELAGNIEQQYGQQFGVYFNGDLICQDTSEKFLVFDQNLGRKKNEESMLNKTRATAIATARDTVWFLNLTEAYYLRPPFNIEKAYHKELLSRNMILFEGTLFRDSIYTILGCGFGEFGGSVFFYNNKTGETRYYPAYAPVQVLKQKDGYVVINSLAHLSGSSEYLQFASPQKLYLWQAASDGSFCCNCDKLYTRKNRGDGYIQDSLFGVKQYYELIGGLTFLTFPYQDDLYSIQASDSLYYIVKHETDTVLTVDSFKSAIQYPSAASGTNISHNGLQYIATASGHNTSWTDGSTVETHSFTSVTIIVKGNRIDVLEIGKSATAAKGVNWIN